MSETAEIPLVERLMSAQREISRLQSRIEELERKKDRLMLGSAKGRIKVIARGVAIQTHAFALAELVAAMAGPGAEIRYIPEGSDDGWSVWTEGETWPDEDDFRYHLFALEVKRLRRERQARSTLEASNQGGK